MARVRDHAAERARRWELELQRAASEGREPSRAKARGHTSHEVENARRRQPEQQLTRQLNYWTKQTAYGLPLDTYREKVTEAVDAVGRAETIEILKAKQRATLDYHARKGNAIGSKGRSRFDDYLSGESLVPVELYWYHSH